MDKYRYILINSNLKYNMEFKIFCSTFETANMTFTLT